MSTVAKEEALLTAEEFGRRPDPGYPEELVRGRIVAMPPPGARHGKVCLKVGRILGNLVEERDLGHVLSNDAGVITRRGPDTVRGADVSFYSYVKVPKASLTEGYPDVPPDLIFEVISPDDRWRKVLEKVSEYLNVGVGIVGVLDPERCTLHLFEGDEPVRILTDPDELILPTLFGPDFRVPVRRFFE